VNVLGRVRARILIAVSLLLTVCLAAAVLSREASRSGGPSGHVTIKILATFDVDPLEPVLNRFSHDTGIGIEIHRMESPEAARFVADGRADGEYDAVWSDTDGFLDTAGASARQLAGGTTIMTTPVLPGLRRTALTRLGWKPESVTWKQIALAASQRRQPSGHQFTIALVDPDTSFSGRSSLLSMAAALADSGEVLSAHDVFAARGALRAIGTHTVSEPTTREMIGRFTAPTGVGLDGIFANESDLLTLNAAGSTQDVLVPIHPRDGAMNADFTVRALMHPRSQFAAAEIPVLTKYLLRPESQKEIMNRGYWRPVAPGVSLLREFGIRRLPSIPVSRNQEVIDRLVQVIQGTYRYPTRTVFLLDVSGSMAGDRAGQMREAVQELSGAGTAGSAGQVSGDDEVILLPFSSTPGRVGSFRVPRENPQGARGRISATLGGLVTGGATAMYDALVEAYEYLKRTVDDSERITSVVVITDGQSNQGRTLAEFERYFTTLPPSLKTAPAYPLPLGDADPHELNQVAQVTGGEILDYENGGLARTFSDLRDQP
jgi:Ca-activated chloride channel family protein